MYSIFIEKNFLNNPSRVNSLAAKNNYSEESRSFYNSGVYSNYSDDYRYGIGKYSVYSAYSNYSDRAPKKA